MDESHTEDLRNVREGDTIDVETSEGDTFRMTCTGYSHNHDQDPDKVREYRTWDFEQEGAEVVIQITDGLKSFEWETEYRRHTPMYDSTSDVSLGYITDLTIYGQMEA
jgi:hypothetical protein